jgi:hypothetical protein
MTADRRWFHNGVVAGDKASAHCQPAQRHKQYAPGNVFLLAVELLFTLAVARVRNHGQGARTAIRA